MTTRPPGGAYKAEASQASQAYQGSTRGVTRTSFPNETLDLTERSSLDLAF